MFQSTFDAMQPYFDKMKTPDAASPSGYSWTTAVPVYDWSDCGNPHGTITIVGFATMKITVVVGAPQKTI